MFSGKTLRSVYLDTLELYVGDWVMVRTHSSYSIWEKGQVSISSVSAQSFAFFLCLSSTFSPFLWENFFSLPLGDLFSLPLGDLFPLPQGDDTK